VVARSSASRILVGNLMEGDHIEDQGVYRRRIILKWIFENWHGGIDWIDMARDRWRAVVNRVKNLWGPQNWRNFLTS
jgi:hypothetical protein